MKKYLESIVKKNGNNYSTFLDIDATISLIKEYYRKFKRVNAEVDTLSCVEGCGTNKETGKPIIKGRSAFSVTYNAGVNWRTDKTVIKKEWVEELKLAEMIKELFESYNYETNKITFHSDLYLLKPMEKSFEGKELLISEETASKYDTRELGSKPKGISISFSKKNNIFKEAVLSLKKLNQKNRDIIGVNK